MTIRFGEKMMLRNKIFVVLDIYLVGISFYLIVVIVMIYYDLIKFEFVRA